MQGAKRAAFVVRPGMVLGGLDEQPDVVVPTMTDVVTMILERDTAHTELHKSVTFANLQK